MEVKAVSCCVPLCLLSLGNSRFTIEKSALFYKLWCVQCQFFFSFGSFLPIAFKNHVWHFKMQTVCESTVWGEKEGSEKGATLVSCHRLGTALCAVRGLPWCSPWLLGTGLLRLAGWLCPQQRSSPRHLRLEPAEEQTGICWGLLPDLGVAPQSWNAG